MTNKHINQVLHNKTFLSNIHQRWPEQYFDWKITVCFYIALHYVKALALEKKVFIGDSHYAIDKNVNPERPNVKLNIPPKIWKAYKYLFYYSQSARYSGIINKNSFNRVQQRNYVFCETYLKHIIQYMSQQGISI